MSYTLAATNYPYLWTCSLAECLTDLARQGFTQLELMVAPPHVSTASGDPTPTELRSLLRRHGLLVSSLNLSGLDWNLASAWPEVRALAVAEYVRLVELAAELSAPRVVVLPGRRHSLLPAPLETALAWAGESVAALTAPAERLGVELVVENVPFGFLETVAQVNDFVARIGHPSVAALFDTANAHMVENEVDAAGRSQPTASLVHLSDTTRGTWLHEVPGTGDVAFRPVTEALRERAYDGDAVIELTVANPRTAFETSAEVLETMGWRRAA